MTKRRGNNEGSIWKERKKWRTAIRLENGKRITRTYKTKAECINWLDEKKNQLRQGMIGSSSNVMLRDFVYQWLSVHEFKLAPKTALRYRQLARDYILPRFGETKLGDLRLDQIEAHYQDLLQFGLKPRTIRFVHAVLRKCLNDAVRRRHVGYNAAQGATLPRPEPNEMQILNVDEAMRFLISIQGSRFEALYHVAIKTGMRRGELLGLKWSDLNWKNGTILVQRQVQRIHKQGLVFRSTKTRAGRRTVQLGEQTLQFLQTHLNRQQIERKLAGKQWQEMNLVFASKVGTPLEGSTLLKEFKTELERAGLNKMRFHDLRHTAASLMLNHGVPVLVVSKMLGHSKTSTTLDIYGHLIPVMQEEAAKIMDEIVTPIPVELGEMLAAKTPS